MIGDEVDDRMDDVGLRLELNCEEDKELEVVYWLEEAAPRVELDDKIEDIELRLEFN